MSKTLVPGRVIWLAMLAFCWAGMAARAAAPVAQVTGVSGAVSVESGGAKKACKMFMSLAAGDRLTVPAGASVILFFFADNHREQIKGEAAGTVTEKGAQVPGDHKAVTQAPGALKVAGGTLQGLNSDQYGGSVKRAMSTEESSLVATSPHQTLSVTPTLRWTAVPGAATYVVGIQKQFGEPPFWTAAVSETRVTVPQSLEPGHAYIWKVEARDAAGASLADDISDLEVLSRARQQDLEAARREFDDLTRRYPDEATPYMLMAGRYLQDGLTEEAIGILRLLSQKHPDDPYPLERMAALYRSLNMQDEARALEDKVKQPQK